MTKIEEAKKRFLLRYNPTQSIRVALSKAINASVQRNRYLSPADKSDLKKIKEIRKEWETLLETIAITFKEKQNEESYGKTIELVRESVNLKSGDSKIKISHAQKSLAVFLKHLWCFDKDKLPTRYASEIFPVHCPVDAVILRKIKWAGKPWTSIDSIDDHFQMITAIKNFIKNSDQNYSLIEWEVLSFIVDS